jgi:LEM3 (ligand-effect modulator 3) family / CDC50 family
MLYYRLTNFYQNHRRYVKSVDQGQLQGENKTPAQLQSDGGCTPLTLAPNGNPYYPCGLIANSLFNGILSFLESFFYGADEDTFNSPVQLNVDNSSAANVTYVMTNSTIAWASDLARFGKTKYTNDQVEPPPNWFHQYPNGYTDENPIPDLSTFYEFQVWMRTAGLPTFSKLALRNPNEVMKAGTYQIDIALSMVPVHNHTLTLDFPVTEYGGTKTLVLSTRTVIGGQNNFLGIAYIVVAGLCILLGALFTARHLIKPRYFPPFFFSLR